MNILLTISYDGTNYHGWQRQKDFITVQGKLEEGLTNLFKKYITVRGASRTDSGVHALGQRANFYIDTTILVKNMPYAINNFLPNDIVVTDAKLVEENFHPQFDTKNKTYRYQIYNNKFPNPMNINYSWFLKNDINIDLIREGSKYILGEHDFSCFCASGSYSTTNIRTVNFIDIKEEDNYINFYINGNGFLYNMVRIIVGTLYYVGINKIEPKKIKEIILSKDRTQAGKTAPACGLTLMEVNY